MYTIKYNENIITPEENILILIGEDSFQNDFFEAYRNQDLYIVGNNGGMLTVVDIVGDAPYHVHTDDEKRIIQEFLEIFELSEKPKKLSRSQQRALTILYAIHSSKENTVFLIENFELFFSPKILRQLYQYIEIHVEQNDKKYFILGTQSPALLDACDRKHSILDKENNELVPAPHKEFVGHGGGLTHVGNWNKVYSIEKDVWIHKEYNPEWLAHFNMADLYINQEI